MTGRPAVIVFHPYCPDSIGEQAVQIPFLRFLRRARPDAEIVGVLPERSGAVLDALGLLDRPVGYAVRAGVPALLRAAGGLRALGCDEVYQLRRKSWRAALLARLATGAPVRGFAHGGNRFVQTSSIPYDHGVYIAENYTRLLGHSVAEFAAAFPATRGEHVLIIPGGRTSIKRYPLEQYRVVARDLARDRPVRFLLGPDAREERARLTDAGDGVEVCFAPAIDEVARLVRTAALVVANDCGPGHFAHIHDVPRVAVFDRGIDPAPWFFPGRNGRLLRSAAPGEIAGIPPGAILELAHELLGTPG
jgi:ADP-heptose:LPS heptosyltransferase